MYSKIVSPKLLVLFPALLLISCEDKEKIDEPTIIQDIIQEMIITYPIDNEEIYEIVTVQCSTKNMEEDETITFKLLAEDKSEISILGPGSDTREEILNTTFYTDANYKIAVHNEDNTVGDTVSVIINNTLANPSQINITSITPFSPYGYETHYTIVWPKSQDGDFGSYSLDMAEDMESFDSTYQNYFWTDHVDSTSYVFVTDDPSIDRFFRITVVDTFGFATKGQIISSTGFTVPELLEIVSVTYDTTYFHITWRKSNNPKFHYYELKCNNDQENGVSGNEIFGTLYDINDTIFSVSGFTPVVENHFFVRQVDSLGLKPQWYNGINNPWGTESRLNTIGTEDLYVDVVSIDYDSYPRTFTWEESQDPFFKSYELLWNGNEGGEHIPLDTIFNLETITAPIDYWDNDVEWNSYYVKVIDYWDVKAIGQAYTLEDPGPSPVSITDASYDENGLTIIWEISNEADFYSYELLTVESDWPDENLAIDPLAVIYDNNQNSFTLAEIFIGENGEVYFSSDCNCGYLFIRVTDMYANTSITEGIILRRPNPVRLHYGQYINGSTLAKWEVSDESAFESYVLYSDDNEDMANSTQIFSTTDVLVDSFFVPNIPEESIKYYQIGVVDTTGFEALSNINVGTGWTTFSETFNAAGGNRPTITKSRAYETTDGGYIMASSGRIIRFSSELEMIWDLNEIIGDMDILNDGNIIVSDGSFIKKIDIDNGSYFWGSTPLFEDIYTYTTNITELNDGNIVAVKTAGQSSISYKTAVYKFNENGDSLSYNEYIFDEKNLPRNVMATDDGGMLITGKALTSDNSNLGFLHKINQSDSTEWYIVLDNVGNETIEMDNQYVVTMENFYDDYVQLASIGKDNGIITGITDPIETNPYWNPYNGILKRQNSNELILAIVTYEGIYWPSGATTQGIEIIRMDNNFNEIVRNHIGDDWEYVIYNNPHLSNTTDGGFILTSPLARVNIGGPWITKIDPFGNSPLLSPHNYE